MVCRLSIQDNVHQANIVFRMSRFRQRVIRPAIETAGFRAPVL
jgi:hypothetical protein